MKLFFYFSPFILYCAISAKGQNCESSCRVVCDPVGQTNQFSVPGKHGPKGNKGEPGPPGNDGIDAEYREKIEHFEQMFRKILTIDSLASRLFSIKAVINFLKKKITA